MVFYFRNHLTKTALGHHLKILKITTKSDLKEYNSSYCTVNYSYYGSDEIFVDFFQGSFYKTASLKKLEAISYEQIAKAFNRNDLIIYTNPEDFKEYLFNLNLENSALLLMSSGNYGGLNFNDVKKLVN